MSLWIFIKHSPVKVPSLSSLKRPYSVSIFIPAISFAVIALAAIGSSFKPPSSNTVILNQLLDLPIPY
jgi:hypothetical protein